jgi:hypothetical protein
LVWLMHLIFPRSNLGQTEPNVRAPGASIED